MELQKPRRHTQMYRRPSIDPEHPENHLGRYVQDPEILLRSHKPGRPEVTSDVVEDVQIAQIIVRDELDKLGTAANPGEGNTAQKAAQLALLDEYFTEKFGEPPETNQ